MNNYLLKAKSLLRQIVNDNSLLDVNVSVCAEPLTPEEAIGTPGRRDFPIIEGKERVLEARVLGKKGQAYTDSPKEFIGSLREILELELSTSQNRAIFIATMNAILQHLKKVDGTVHCKDDEPEKCSVEIAKYILDNWGKVRVGLIGLNPAIAEALANTFGKDNVKISDLNSKNVGEVKFGVKIWNGRTMTEQLINQSDVILITGTTLVNDTFSEIHRHLVSYKKNYLIYGVTCAGICSLLKLKRICPYGKNE